MTKLFLALAFLVTSHLAFAKDINGLIVGGVDAKEGEFPSIVSLRSASKSHFCGGTLIKRNWVLTAAHCAVDSYTKSLVVGLVNQKQADKGESFTPEQVVIHPKYNDGTSDFDYALIRLSGNASFRPTEIAREEVAGDTISTVAGWGYTRENGFRIPDQLQKVDVPVVSKEACAVAYPDSITDRMICAGLKAGGKDSCQGDSGGPLFVLNSNNEAIIAGVVSWGNGCARPDAYGVYSKVSAVAEWIDETTSN